MLINWSAQCVFALGLLLTPSARACFVGECPLDVDISAPTNECMSCLNGRGRCVNSNTCCGNEIGCLAFQRGGSKCYLENQIPVACRVQGDKKCGPRLDGNCVLDGICCNLTSCEQDDSCV